MVATVSRFIVICWQLLVLGARYAGGRLACWMSSLWQGPARIDRERRVEQLKGRCLTAFFRDLGATFIKIGQILSTRRDLLAPGVIAELESLQDRVPALPFEVVRRVIEQDLGRPLEAVYARFDETPVAAGSIAQVHEARLLTGEHVAVKIQRPDIARNVDRDLALIVLLARLAHRIPTLRPIGLPSLASEFGCAIRAQLDFGREIANNRRFAANFADLAHVKVPPVFDDACGDRVITMGFVRGFKLTCLPADRQWDRRLLARRLVNMYHRMLLKDFFLHADLHPANILIDENGDLHLIDTGLVYEIPAHYVEKFVRVGTGLMLRNARFIVEGYLEGVDLPAARREEAVAEIEQLLRRNFGGSLSEVQIGEVLASILRLLRRHGIQLDAEWSGIILSDLTFAGIAKSLDKEVDILQLTVQALPGFVAGYDFIAGSDPLRLATAAAA
jgi:ubiquinone biosynthesis protein